MGRVHVLHLKETIDFDQGKYTEEMFKGRDYAPLSNVQLQKKIHTHPMEGHQKFLGGGGSYKSRI